MKNRKELNRNGIYPIQKNHETPALAEQTRMFFACPPLSPPAKAGGYSVMLSAQACHVDRSLRREEEAEWKHLLH